jgi:hypothetical protein
MGLRAILRLSMQAKPFFGLNLSTLPSNYWFLNRPVGGIDVR